MRGVLGINAPLAAAGTALLATSLAHPSAPAALSGERAAAGAACVAYVFAVVYCAVRERREARS